MKHEEQEKQNKNQKRTLKNNKRSKINTIFVVLWEKKEEVNISVPLYYSCYLS